MELNNKKIKDNLSYNLTKDSIERERQNFKEWKDRQTTKTLFYVEERTYDGKYLESNLIKSIPYLSFNDAIRALKYYEKSDVNNIVEIVKHTIDESKNTIIYQDEEDIEEEMEETV